MTLRIGWFSPISAETGIASYTAQVLEQMCVSPAGKDVEVIVFHPPFEGERVEMPCPTIELSESLLESDFWALFDVAVYHLGNNSRHHKPIYTALMRHPGLIVLHDHVYQHYLAGVSLQGDFIGTSYVSLAQNAHPGSFQVLKSSGVMRADQGQVHFVPWESEWAARVPLSDRFVGLGLGTLVHSDYARHGLTELSGNNEDILTLFMPRPDLENVPPPKVTTGPVRIACCGHIGSTKGLIELVNSFIQAPHLRHSFHITIAGFGSDTAFLQILRETITKARLNAVFEIKIAPSDAEYQEIMTQCDLFYNLRYPNTEGASLSLMEQLAYGRPVIAYRTGSFAEVPEEACYFLDTVGDTQCLIDMLSHISGNLSEIEAKGHAAQAAVAGKTAAAYVGQFVKHVRSNLKTYQRRANLSHMRARRELVDQEHDMPWLLRFLEARKEMQDFYAGALYVPRNFADMSPQTKGIFVVANFLNTQVHPGAAARIGNVLDELSQLELYDLLGKLLTISSIGNDHQMLDQTLCSAALPITDLQVWRILAHLEHKTAASMALRALGMQVNSDLHYKLAQMVSTQGFRYAVHSLLQEQPAIWSSQIERTPLGRFLKDMSADRRAALPTVPVGDNVIEHLQSLGSAGSLVIYGFHPLESIGAWTSHLDASLQINLPEGDVARAAHGSITVLQDAVTSGDKVRLSIEEMSSNRRTRCKLHFDAERGDTHLWHMDLDEFSGTINIEIEITQLHSPSKDGVNGDTRKLGALLQNLTFLDQPVAPPA